MATRVRFIDLYSLCDEVDANIIENLLDDYDIEYLVRQYGAGSAPAMEGVVEKMISVEEGRIGEAKQIIKNAIDNGFISEEGEFTA